MKPDCPNCQQGKCHHMSSDKEKEIAGLLVGALKAGYKITIEHDAIGVIKQGTQVHVTYLDEVVNELGHINLWDHINEGLEEMND